MISWYIIYISGYVQVSKKCLYKYLHIWTSLHMLARNLRFFQRPPSNRDISSVQLPVPLPSGYGSGMPAKGNNQILKSLKSSLLDVDTKFWKNETFHVICSHDLYHSCIKKNDLVCCKSRSDTKGPTSSSPCRRPVQIVGWVSTTNAIHQRRKSLRICTRMAFFRSARSVFCMWWVLNFGRCQSCT